MDQCRRQLELVISLIMKMIGILCKLLYQKGIKEGLWEKMTFGLNFEGCSIGSMMSHIQSTYCLCLSSEPLYGLRYSGSNKLQTLFCFSKSSIYLDSTLKMIIRKDKGKGGIQNLVLQGQGGDSERECRLCKLELQLWSPQDLMPPGSPKWKEKNLTTFMCPWLKFFFHSQQQTWRGATP